MNAATIAPPETCETVERIVARCGGEIAFLPEPAARGREPATATTAGSAPPPLHHASAELAAFWRTLSTGEPPGRFLARIPGGRLVGAGNVLSPDGRSVARDVSTDFGKSFAEHWLLGFRRLRAPRRLAGRTTVAAVTLGDGYAHWLLDELPRLLTLPPEREGVLLAHTSLAVAREALCALGWLSGDVAHAPVTVREPVAYEHLACDELVVPSLVSTPGEPTPEVVRLITGVAASLFAGGRVDSRNAGAGERIYVSRSRARRRRVANHAELHALLAARGFAELHLEDLSWREQIRAFASAKVIVAPHGAGLANLVFCTPGTRVVELFHRAYVNPGYARLAAVVGLDYRPVVATGGEALACDPRAGRLDVDADLAAVARALA